MGKNRQFIRFAGLCGFLALVFILLSLSSSQTLENANTLPTLAVLPPNAPTSAMNGSITLSTSTPNTPPNTNALLPQEPVANQVVLTFAPNTTTDQQMAYIQSIGGTISKDLSSLNAIVVTLPDNVNVSSLPASSIILSSEHDYYAVALQETVNDPRYADQWSLPVTNAPAAWGELPAMPVTIAVIDSGICAEHPDLQGRIGAGYDFVEGDAVAQDAFGHGCGVAGIIAANNNNAVGIAGLAPNAEIMPLRVLNAQGIGTYSDVASALIYAADHGAQIINLSLGGTPASSLLENAVNYAAERGVVIIAAAGNTGSRVLYPAAYQSVIAVGSIDSTMQVSSFSPSASLDLYAPGRDILTTQMNGDYALMTGTSFAAPQVAGIAALEMAYGRSPTIDGGVIRFGGINNPSLPAPTTVPGSISPQYAALLDTVRERGMIRVIASLNVNFQPEGLLSPQGVQTQQTMIAQAQQSLMNALSSYNATLLSQSDQWVVPGIAFQVDEAALLYLMSAPEVSNLVEDVPLEQTLNTSAGIVDAPEAWALGYTGTGQTVVIIDSGIESTHSTFGGRVVAEACYSWNQADSSATTDYNERNDSLCGNGDFQQFSSGAAGLSRCTLFAVDCSHGTHIAGIAAGEDTTYRGIAPDANIIAIQVFTRWEDCPNVAGVQQCLLSYTADQISALNYVYTNLRVSYNIAAINVSIGAGRYFGACDAQNVEMTNIINQLYAANIATVIASSNNGYSDSISFPACVSNAISVASSTDSDQVSSYSNADTTLDLLAPGDSIMSAIAGNTFGNKTGTSMATPHVVGAWALLREAVPSLTVADALNALQTTGVPILDIRNGLTFRRIDIDNAISSFFEPTPPPPSYQTTSITDQELLAAMQAQTDVPLRAVLVLITPNHMNIYVDFGGIMGIARVEIQQGNQVVALSLGEITDIDGNAPSQALIDALNNYLPTLLTGALDQILNARFGPTQDTADMTLHDNYFEVGVIAP